MTPSKDTLELGNLTGEATESRKKSRARPDSGGLRSDAVSLEVPVKVHGSRVTDVVRGVTAHTEPFEEQAVSMIVFPQGGVLKMTSPLSSGQMVVITNLKSGQDAICRVGKVRPYGNSQSYVEIEFTQRQPGYWGVYFPSEGSEQGKKVAPPPAPLVAPTVSRDTPPVSATPSMNDRSDTSAPERSTSPAGAPSKAPAQAGKAASETTSFSAPNPSLERRLQPNLPESRFVSIGTKEDVMPAASETVVTKKNRFATTERSTRSAEPPPKSSSAEIPAPPPEISSSVSMTELRGEAYTGSGHATLEIAESVADAPRPAPQELFGVRLDSATATASGTSGSSAAKWPAIVAGVGILLAAIGGGAYYYERRNTNPVGNPISAAPVASPLATEAPSPAPQPVTSSSAVPPPVAQLTPTTPTASLASEPVIAARDLGVAPAKPPKASPIVTSPTTVSTPPKTTVVVPKYSSALSAHPKSLRTSASAKFEAALDADAIVGNSASDTPVLGNSTVNLVAPAKPMPDVPLRVGGDVKPPRMISSAMPVYPSLARQAGVEGNVLIDTVVDKTGNVTSMKVISGPLMLRQAALDALRQWKYQPGTLNGEPVAVEIAVSIQFHK